ncbi:PilZ domain-containing protein [Thiohalophilus thiocyanatoxydans]|uniref:PilZ domain-containing protein n=1 Tax=Thiohalophilus thiocyanatoxydans TaxID=381308 RepID=A0A4R8IHC7_9GAMM|nr:PilZ domain-containing protein [Thiohalophilus thiocyanatoxydans]TDY00011.1 PilZ domain-containing protein [Thiohalophilus thiocyanatoxydans]
MPQAELNYHERRDKYRLPLNRQVRLSSPTRGVLRVEGVDYSPSGIAVSCPTPLPVGEQIAVCFPVGRTRQTELEVQGEVVHYYRKDGDFVLGIRFLEWLEPPTHAGF